MQSYPQLPLSDLAIRAIGPAVAAAISRAGGATRVGSLRQTPALAYYTEQELTRVCEALVASGHAVRQGEAAYGLAA